MLLSEIDFASYLTYCPRLKDGANNALIQRSKNLMVTIKNEGSIGNPPMLISKLIALKIKSNLKNFPFKDFFGVDVALVPVPKSSLMKSDSLWVPERITKALANQDLGYNLPCLERIHKVPKSSLAKSEDRPKAIDHFDSIKFKPQIYQPKKILLVDDVITRGSTMLGCASILKKAFPNIPIKGFAVLRTISNSDDFVAIEQPCLGKVVLRNENTFRKP